MITDQDTNYIYFSEWLRKDFPQVYGQIDATLNHFEIPHGLLPHTKDYWCRDYMPIQTGINKFVQYRYYPDYLANSQSGISYITDPDKTCKAIGIKTLKTDIIIDGGNIVRCSDHFIMTEKIFKENPHYSKPQLMAELESLFQAEMILLPWDKAERYGHSDGIIHFIDNKRILLTNYKDFDTVLYRKIYKILSSHFNVIELNYTAKKVNKNSWAYINFLQTRNLILVPKLNIGEDDQAFEQISSIYSDYKKNVVQIDMSEIIKMGGALNCISWNIMK